MSQNEAKVYSAILEYGHCKTTELAEITGLPRTRIYDILTKLTAKHLLEKRKNGKQGYHIIPPSESIDMMLGEMKSEFDFRKQALNELGHHLQSVYSNGIGAELTPGVSILEFREAETIILQQLKKVQKRVYIAVSTDNKSIDWRKSGSILASSYTSKLVFKYLVNSEMVFERLKKSVTAFPGFAKMDINFGYNENLHSSFILLDEVIFLFFLGQQDKTELTTLVLMTASKSLVHTFNWMFERLMDEIK